MDGRGGGSRRSGGGIGLPVMIDCEPEIAESGTAARWCRLQRKGGRGGMSHRAGCLSLRRIHVLTGRDVSEAPNTMNRPAVLKFTTTDEQPPEIVYTDLQALPPSSVSVELGLNEPGKAYFVTMGLAELPPTPEQV